MYGHDLYHYYNCTGIIIEGPSNVTYRPGLTSLPIELTCDVTGVVIGWIVNGTDRLLASLTNGALPGHNVTGTNILVNSPANNTKYICVFLNDDGNQITSDTAHVFVAGK